MDTEKNPLLLTPNIKVMGIGGAGGNALGNVTELGIEGVECYVVNTDAQALKNSCVKNKIQIGAIFTRGLGAGSNPKTGKAAAEETIDEISQILDGCDMLFLTAGMGGGTGTGAAPVIAATAKEKGILTVAVVTKPFFFEGKYRMQVAEAGIAELEQYVDTLIVVPNQNLFRVASEHTTFADAFKEADKVLMSGVKGVTDLITMPGLINLDFSDVKTIMTQMGRAMMGTGEAGGEDRAIRAADAAMSNTILDNASMDGARNVMVNITAKTITLFEVDAIVNKIREGIDPDANVIFGSAYDETLEDKIRVSVIATGINNHQSSNISNRYNSSTITHHNQSNVNNLNDQHLSNNSFNQQMNERTNMQNSQNNHAHTTQSDAKFPQDVNRNTQQTSTISTQNFNPRNNITLEKNHILTSPVSHINTIPHSLNQQQNIQQTTQQIQRQYSSQGSSIDHDQNVNNLSKNKITFNKNTKLPEAFLQNNYGNDHATSNNPNLSNNTKVNSTIADSIINRTNSSTPNLNKFNAFNIAAAQNNSINHDYNHHNTQESSNITNNHQHSNKIFIPPKPIDPNESDNNYSNNINQTHRDTNYLDGSRLDTSERHNSTDFLTMNSSNNALFKMQNHDINNIESTHKIHEEVNNRPASQQMNTHNMNKSSSRFFRKLNIEDEYINLNNRSNNHNESLISRENEDDHTYIAEDAQDATKYKQNSQNSPISKISLKSTIVDNDIKNIKKSSGTSSFNIPAFLRKNKSSS